MEHEGMGDARDARRVALSTQQMGAPFGPFVLGVLCGLVVGLIVGALSGAILSRSIVTAMRTFRRHFMIEDEPRFEYLSQ